MQMESIVHMDLDLCGLDWDTLY